MRKILSLVLVLSLVLGSFSFAFAAPADVVGTEYEEAVDLLSVLGVLTGYEDGTFRPDNTITRAEFAAVVVRALGLDAAAKLSGGTTQFSDANGHWASGYINIAAGQEIVNGYPDGTFRPEEPVTYEQAVTMIVRALGYEPAIVGGYPAGYLAKAAELEITDAVKGTVGAPATRGIVAQIVFNSLEVEMMERTTFGDEANYETKGKNLLEDKLGVTVYEDRTVVSFDDDDMEVTVQDEDGDEDTYDYADTVSFKGLENAVVELWKLDDEIVRVSVESKVLYDFVNNMYDEDDNSTDTVADVVKIKLENADKTYKVKSGTDLAGVADGDFVKVVINDNRITHIEDYTLDKAGIITDVEEDVIKYIKGDVTKKLRDLDDAEEMLVIINGEVATYDDLEEGMYFDYDEYDDDEYVIVATDETLVGEFERVKYDDGEIKIDGDYYDVASTYYLSTDGGEDYAAVASEDDFNDVFGEEVKVYFNNIGEIVYITSEVEETTDSFYGFAYAVDTFSDKIKVIKVVDGDIDTVSYEYDLDSDSEVDFDTIVAYDVDGDGYTNDDTLADVLADGYDYSDNDKELALFFEFVYDEDGVITEIKSVTTTTVTPDKFDDDNDIIVQDPTYYYVDEDAVFFDISADDEVVYRTWDEIKATSFTAGQLVLEADDTELALGIFTTVNSAVDFGDDEDYEFGFVTDRERLDKDYYEFEIVTLDGTVTLTVDEDETSSAGSYDVVAYDLVSDDEAEIVAKAVYSNLTAVADKDDDWTSGSGTVDEDGISGSYIEIGGSKYKVASDAIIYEVVDASDDDYEVADLSDIDDEGTTRDNVSFLAENGVIKVLFFWE